MSTMCVLTVTLRLILIHREAIIYQKNTESPKITNVDVEIAIKTVCLFVEFSQLANNCFTSL